MARHIQQLYSANTPYLRHNLRRNQAGFSLGLGQRGDHLQPALGPGHASKDGLQTTLYSIHPSR
jgi:hypothetical protein